ncbi:MAG TPA: hypothetical protein VF796_13185 [Humisphaera sp.]
MLSLDRGTRECVVVDGVAGPAYEAVYGLTFSPDGTRYAYIARHGFNDWFAVVDGREGRRHAWVPFQAYDRVEPIGRPIKFSPDSRRVAYAAKDEQGIIEYGRSDLPKLRDAYVYIDGERSPGPPTYNIGVFDWSPDSKGVAYVAEVEQRTGPAGGVPGLQAVVWQGKQHDTYQEIEPMLRFSPDGLHLAYYAWRVPPQPGRWADGCVVLDGRPDRRYFGHDIESLRFTPDGRVEYDAWAWPGGRPAIAPADPAKPAVAVHVRGDEELQGRRERLVYSPDGRREAFVRKVEPRPGETEFSLIQRRGGRYPADVYLDGRLVAEVPGGPFYMQFGPDSRRFVFLAPAGDPADEKLRLYVDGAPLDTTLPGHVIVLRFTGPDMLRAVVVQPQGVEYLDVPVRAQPRTALQ